MPSHHSDKSEKKKHHKRRHHHRSSSKKSRSKRHEDENPENVYGVLSQEVKPSELLNPSTGVTSKKISSSTLRAESPIDPAVESFFPKLERTSNLITKTYHETVSSISSITENRSLVFQVQSSTNCFTKNRFEADIQLVIERADAGGPFKAMENPTSERIYDLMKYRNDLLEYKKVSLIDSNAIFSERCQVQNLEGNI